MFQFTTQLRHVIQKFGLLIITLLISQSIYAQTPLRPTSHSSSDGGLLCIGTFTANEARAYDNDPSLTTHATLQNAVGLACFAQETVKFGQTAKPGDTIVVYLGTNGGLLDLTLLANARIQLKKGSSNVGSSIVLNSSLLNLTLLSGKQIGYIKLPISADADGVQIYVGGLLSLLVSLDIYDIQLKLANPVVTDGLSQQICSGQSATINVTTANGTTIDWYDTPTGGIPLQSNSNSFTTPVLTNTTTYYIQVNRSGGGNLERLPVVVNVLNTPEAPLFNPNPLEVCSGSAAIIGVANSQPGITYNWYSQPIGGSLVFSGTVNSIPNVTADQTFYVEANNGSCSSLRTAVAVKVNNRPAEPQLITQNSTINPGETVMLSAISADNTTVDWYLTSIGGSPVGSGNNFTTAPLSSTTTFYAETRSTTNGCTSIVRVPVTVFINTNPATACNMAKSQVTEFSPALLLVPTCLLCSVLNPENAVDNDLSSASHLSVPIGVAGYIQQTLIFNKTTSAGDTIEVDLGIPTGVLDVSALSFISVASYNGTTYNNDRKLVNSGLLKITLLGGNRFKVKFVPASTADRIQIRLGGLATLLTSLRIYGAQIKAPEPQAYSKDVTVCAGEAAFLYATPAAGTTIAWYDQSTGGNLLQSGNNYSTAPLTSNTTVYIEVSRNGCPNSERIPVNINIKTVQPVTVSSNASAICKGDAITLTVTNAESGVTYNWYKQSTGGSPFYAGNSLTTDTLTGTRTFYVERFPNDCSISRTAVTVNVNPLPADPQVVTSNPTINSGQNITLQATTADANVVIDWYNMPGGTLVHTGNSYTTPTLTSTTTYYLIARNTVTGCVTTKPVTITVTVNNTSGGDCLAASTQMVSADGVCIGCAGYNASNAVDNDPSTFSTLSIPVGILGSISQTLVFNNQGEIGDTIKVDMEVPVGLLDISALSFLSLETMNGAVNNNDELFVSSLLKVQLLGGNKFSAYFVATKPYDRVTIKLAGLASVLNSINIYGASVKYPDPTIPTSTVEVCKGSSAVLSATPAAGTTLKWYDLATGGTLLHTGNTFTTPVITSNTIYYLEVSRNGCPDHERIPVKVNIIDIQPPVILSSASSICKGMMITLTIDNPEAGATYNWYKTATGGTSFYTGTSLATDTLTGSRNFYVEKVKGSCSSSSRGFVSVILNNPQAPNVSASANAICKGSMVTFTVNNPQGGVTYNWYKTATGGSSIFTGTSLSTDTITYDRSFYVEAETNGCTSLSRTKIDVQVNDPKMPTLSAGSVTICKNELVTLTVSTPQAGVTYAWYKTSTGGTSFFIGNSLTTDTITANNSFYVEAIQGNCSSSARAKVDVQVNYPQAPTVSASAGAICKGSMVTLSVINPKAGTIYNWYLTANGGSSFFTGTALSTDTITANRSFYVEAVQGTCSSATRAKADVQVNDPQTPSVSASANAICRGSMVTFTVNNPQVGVVYKWYRRVNSTTPLFTGTSLSTDTITANRSFYVEATQGGCASGMRAQVSVLVNDPQTPTVSASANTICKGSMVTLSVNNPKVGTTYNWYLTANGSSPIFTGTVLSTDTLTANRSFYVEAVQGTCSSSARCPVSIIIQDTPPEPEVIPPFAMVCSGSTVSLQATSTTSGLTYKWYDVPTGGAVLYTGSVFITPAITADKVYYVESVYASGPCTNSASKRVAVDVKVIITPPAPTVSASPTICSGQRTTLTATAAMGGIDFKWYTQSSGGNAVFVGTNFLTPLLTTSTTFYVESTLPGGCSPSARIPVAVNVSSVPDVPVVSSGTVQICSGTSTTLHVTPITGLTYKWYTSATGGTSVHTGTDFVTPAILSSTSYYVECESAGGCTSLTRTPVTVNVIDLLASPVVHCDKSTSDAVTFVWDNVAGATAYKVSVDGGNYEDPSSGANGTSHKVTGLKYGDNKIISVIAVGSQVCATSQPSWAESCQVDLAVDLYIPNAFSPNNDGNNDIFYVRGSVAKLKLVIYNQWGRLLFESNNLNNGWDGKFYGIEQPVGVYVYVAEATLTNGEEVKKKGSVSLIR